MTAAASTVADLIRVMVVDDSAVIRTLITRILEEDSQVSVVATAGNGQIALDNLSANDIDVIVLDIEMPVMDGLTALPKLLEAEPGIKIIMASTLSTRNADISIRAMHAGAADYVPKPSSSRDIRTGNDFRREILAKVFGPGVLSVIPTGMGHDGLNGGEAVAKAGGTVIAQDEDSSVVWGMPGAVATAGLCSAVLPITELAPYITRHATRGGS